MSQQYLGNSGFMAPPPQTPPKAPARTGLMTMLAMVVLIFAILVILNETMLKIQPVAVVGNERFTWEQVVTAAGLDRPTSYFTVSEQAIRRSMSANHYLVFERMEKQFPNRVTLYVHERTPIARVQDMGTEFVLDEEGMVLENFAVGKEDAYDGLMFITGLKPKDMRVGQIMQAGTVVQTEAFKALVREVILQGITDEISELNLADPENLYLITVDQYTAHLGNAENLRAKIGTVRAVTAYLRSEGYHGGMMEANIPGEVIYSPLSP